MKVVGCCCHPRREELRVSWTSLGAVALLRGINVGGRTRIPMADLRAVASDLGMVDPRTHLQSGNLVFTTSPDDLTGVGDRLEAAIADAFGVDVRVLIRTHDDLAGAVARNPFAVAAAADPKTVHLLFLDRAPTTDEISRLDPERSYRTSSVCPAARSSCATRTGRGARS
jgi:uncharacterized protein (DUF1697 family)